MDLFGFKIKFQYNVRSHWRISVRIFLQELLNLEDYFLYDLGNEEENEFFAAVDLENVNVSDKVDRFQKPTEAPKVNKYRFVNKTQQLQCSPACQVIS